MLLESSSIAPNSEIPLTHTEPSAGGTNRIPDLRWSDAPEGTQSFALTIYDPDAPTGSGWWHWVASDIPVTVTSVPEGGALPEGSREWPNDYGYLGYGGAAPPPGPGHRYIHTVYALPMAKLPVPEGATSAQARFTILANALDSASFTATFALPS